METSTSNLRLIAIDPNARGLGFAVMEGLETLVDWGVKEARGEKNRVCLKCLTILMDEYEPDLLLLENCADKRSHHCKRVICLVQKIRQFALKRNIRTKCLSPKDVKDAFAQWQAVNKHQIAMVIGNLYPELIPRIPPERKCWMSEDYRTGIFDAVALGIAYFYRRKKYSHTA